MPEALDLLVDRQFAQQRVLPALAALVRDAVRPAGTPMVDEYVGWRPWYWTLSEIVNPETAFRLLVDYGLHRAKQT